MRLYKSDEITHIDAKTKQLKNLFENDELRFNNHINTSENRNR